jgi:hypothetical protein
MSVVFTEQECGCVLVVVANNPRALSDAWDELGATVREDRPLHFLDTEAFQRRGFECAPHRREHAERASLVELGL